MTVGIVLKPVYDNFIVTVTDMRVSLGHTVAGVDTGTVKDQRLDDNWGFLFAAEEIGYNHSHQGLSEGSTLKNTRSRYGGANR